VSKEFQKPQYLKNSLRIKVGATPLCGHMK
jgi:hypothetical protein